jgi:Domain of unknown function (DUF932)
MSYDISLYRRGTHPVDRETLCRIPVTARGERSDRWSGIQHGVLATTVVDRLQAADLEVTKEEWSVGRGAAHLFGYLDLDTSGSQTDLEQLRGLDETGTLDRWQTGYGGYDPHVVGLRMGVVHSNDSAFALRLIVMPKVLVCENGLVVEGGSIACVKKHTRGLDLVPALDEGIRTFLSRSQSIDGTIQRLKEIEFGYPERADHLLVEAGRRQIMPWSALGKVEKAWREPPHQDFTERTGWSLYNAFTEVAKGFSMRKEMLACDQARQLILSEEDDLNN